MAFERENQGVQFSKLRMLTICGPLVAASLLTGCGPTKQGPLPTSVVAEIDHKPGTGPTLGSQAPTTDPIEIVKRMVKAYKAVDSLQVATSDDELAVSARPGGTHMETVTTYTKLPMPRIKQVLVDRISGSWRLFADGSNLVSYQGMANQFTRRQVISNDLSTLGKEIDVDGHEIMGIPAILAADEIPSGMENLKFGGKEDIKGKSAYIVTGTYTNSFVKALGVKSGLTKASTANSGTYKFWIDANTYFLLKAESHFDWTLVIPSTKQRVPLQIVFTLRTVGTVVNPSVKESEFTFVMPPQAQEIFPPKAKSDMPATTDPFKSP